MNVQSWCAWFEPHLAAARPLPRPLATRQVLVLVEPSPSVPSQSIVFHGGVFCSTRFVAVRAFWHAVVGSEYVAWVVDVVWIAGALATWSTVMSGSGPVPPPVR